MKLPVVHEKRKVSDSFGVRDGRFQRARGLEARMMFRQVAGFLSDLPRIVLKSMDMHGTF